MAGAAVKRAVCVLTVAALTAAYLWAINGVHADMQGWDEVDLHG